ncbi:MAG: hypothetical protein D6709_11680 [Chloroflexi bacterium]|nr:MAG: hypothetical protein D6709_11680 [Chloroflexota bacterium]
MDTNLPVLIAALVIGFIIGSLLAQGRTREIIRELESRVRTAQTFAESAKRDFTNAQSELVVKDSHIQTLNAHIGILQAKGRLAEQGREASQAAIAQLQDELRRCHAQLDELRAQLARALAEADELRARITIETPREIAALRAQLATETTQEDTAGFQAMPTTPEFETEVIAAAPGKLTAPADAAVAAEASPAAGAAPQIATAELEARVAALQNEVRSLRDGLATLAFAGAELVAMYEERAKAYEDRLRHLQAQSPETTEQQGIPPAQTAERAAGGAARAEATQPGEPTPALRSQLDALQAELDAVFADKAELETQLQAHTTALQELQKKYEALCADFDTEIAQKAELTAQLDIQTAQLGDLRAQLSAVEADLQAWLLTQLKVPEGEIPADLTSKLALLRSITDALKQAKEDAEARLQESDARLTRLNEQLAKLQRDLETGAQAQAELHTQLAELQDRLNAAIAERDALKATIEAKATTPVTEASPDERLALIREYVKRTKEAAMRAAVESGSEVRFSECPQDLAMAKGIGTVFEQRLYAAGIGTFWELAHLTDDDFKRILVLDGPTLLRVDFGAVRADAQRLAIETNSVGRMWQGTAPDDLKLLEGIGSVYERKLYDAGICTYKALANTPIERLMKICPPNKLRKPDYAGWIAQARSLAQARRPG